jgi:hypothetical protein
MKVSKTYLKKVINEEYKKIINEASFTEDVLVKMKASDYLKLTTDEQTRQYLKKRFEIEGMDYFPTRAGDLFLAVRNDKVVNHEGRNRAYANIKKNGPDAENIVLITIENNRYDDLTRLRGQLEDDAYVDVENFKVIQANVEDQVSNFLNFGDEPVNFKALVYPPNPYMPEERVKPGFEEFLQFVEDKYAPYASNYRKLNNIENFTGEQRNEFYKNYIDQINNDYIISDSEGPLKLLHKGFRRVELDRKPNPRDTITLEKK